MLRGKCIISNICIRKERFMIKTSAFHSIRVYEIRFSEIQGMLKKNNWGANTNQWYNILCHTQPIDTEAIS